MAVFVGAKAHWNHWRPSDGLREKACDHALVRGDDGLMRSVPLRFRMSGEVMITIILSSKWGTGLGQQIFARKTNKLPPFAVLALFNAEGVGPPPMIVVPTSKTAKQVFADFQGRFVQTSADTGWVNGKAWTEWATVFCEWLEMCRERLGMPGQPAALFVNGAPTRGNVAAREIFRAHRVYLLTFPPHLTQMLQHVDVSWVQAFKAELVKRFSVGAPPSWSHICATYCTLPEVCRP
jgi:hypothetical protein